MKVMPTMRVSFIIYYVDGDGDNDDEYAYGDGDGDDDEDDDDASAADDDYGVDGGDCVGGCAGDDDDDDDIKMFYFIPAFTGFDLNLIIINNKLSPSSLIIN